jgi:hypothetical protein
LDTPPLKLLDAVKHSVEDKRFFLSEQLLNVGSSFLAVLKRPAIARQAVPQEI